MADVFYTGEHNKVSLGDYGFDLLETGTHTGSWRIIECLEAASITFTNLADNQQHTIDLTPGFKIFGIFESIVVASGKIITYKDKI